MDIARLEVDEAVADHIARHRVKLEEVEEVLFGAHLQRRARLGRLLLLGANLRWALPACCSGALERGAFRPVTARDMTRAERAYYRRRFK